MGRCCFTGKSNLDRLIQITQENVYRLINDASNQDELSDIRRGINFINDKLLPSAIKKPLLPRLRSECFSKGDKVYIYLGDTPSSIAKTDWVKADITEVEKSYKAEWFDASPNSGYYWRLTATTESQVFQRDNFVAFSTSEPRVLFDWEYNYLQQAKETDARFLEVFSKNAWRKWLPLWCLERQTNCNVDQMDMKAWLLAGSMS